MNYQNQTLFKLENRQYLPQYWSNLGFNGAVLIEIIYIIKLFADIYIRQL